MNHQKGPDFVEKSMKKYGFYIDYVPLDENRIDCHTHGLEESFNHPNLQITLPINPKVACELMHCVVDLIKGGVRFEAGKTYDGILMGSQVRFINAWGERGDYLLRLIIPDGDKVLDEDLLQGPFKLQYYFTNPPQLAERVLH